MKLSVIIISFKSDHLLEKIIKKFPKKYEILIIENSLQKNTKQKLENKYKNLKVIIPEKNLGYATGFNLALKKSKNNFVITITPDVKIEKKLILDLEKIIQNFKNFTLMAPEYRNDKIYKNYSPIRKSSLNDINLKNFKLIQVKEIDWCFCILNKQKFKNKKILDENYFLYFETTDLCNNLYRYHKKMYIVKNLKFDHVGTSSTNKKFNYEIQINRNWHYSWSKFYYFKKNYNYFFAIKKIIPNIAQSIKGLILSLILFKFSQLKLHLSGLKGILSSILLLKSYFRPNVN